MKKLTIQSLIILTFLSFLSATLAFSQVVPKNSWSLKFVDSQELVGEGGQPAINSFDGLSTTMWHTKWFNGTDPLPHEIQINLGAVYSVSGFKYLPRQDGGVNGWIGQYEFYVSTDGATWGTAVATGTFANSATEKQVTFASKTGQYVRLRALTATNGLQFTSAAEITVLGTGPVNQAPNGVINTPASNVTITVGDPVNFTGTGTDADNNLPLTYMWSFGAGSGIANSTAEDPGPVQFYTPGTYTVSFTVTDALLLADPTPATVAVTVQAAGSIAKTGWSLKFVDSQELVGAGGQPAINSFDGLSTTMWHTKWFNGTDPLPHEIQINLGAVYSVSGFKYLPRQDGGVNGRVGQYEFYVSTDGATWGTAVATGTFANSAAEKQVTFTSKTGQYIRLRALTEPNGQQYTSAAEISALGALLSPPTNQAPNGVINTPASNVTITVGDSVNFTGTGTDADNNLPLTYTWGFGAGSGIANSTAEDPGPVQFNTPGTYIVSFTVTDALLLADPTPATATVTVGTGGVIPQTNWRLKFVDSQELSGSDGRGANSFDTKNSTIWHTDWFGWVAPLPHEIQINLGGVYRLTSFSYLPRQDGGVNGRIGQYQFYVSPDGVNWGTAAATGTFANSSALKTVNFATAQTGQYIRLRALTATNGLQYTSAAEINVLGACRKPSLRLVTPLSFDLQTASNLSVTTNACLDSGLHSGWKVRFVLDGGTGNGGAETDVASAPFLVTFPNLTKAEHSVRTVFVNNLGNEVSGSDTEDQANPVGIGDFYVAMGDSITAGSDGDDIISDNTSQDGRNSGGGYPPILNNRLTATKGYPQTVLNHGLGGVTSSYGVSLVPTLLKMYPNAQRFLVLYGMNDAAPWLPVPSGLGLNPGDPGYPGSFKDNMQRIITAINAAGKQVVLAKIPIALGDCASLTTCSTYPDPQTGTRSVLIQQLNLVIDELVANPTNQITIPPPDFYTYFSQHYTTQYSDHIHPNGIGYQSMGRLWCEAVNGGPCN